jgi:hypothetical protein
MSDVILKKVSKLRPLPENIRDIFIIKTEDLHLENSYKASRIVLTSKFAFYKKNLSYLDDVVIIDDALLLNLIKYVHNDILSLPGDKSTKNSMEYIKICIKFGFYIVPELLDQLLKYDSDFESVIENWEILKDYCQLKPKGKLTSLEFRLLNVIIEKQCSDDIFRLTTSNMSWMATHELPHQLNFCTETPSLFDLQKLSNTKLHDKDQLMIEYYNRCDNPTYIEDIIITRGLESLYKIVPLNPKFTNTYSKIVKCDPRILNRFNISHCDGSLKCSHKFNDKYCGLSFIEQKYMIIPINKYRVLSGHQFNKIPWYLYKVMNINLKLESLIVTISVKYSFASQFEKVLAILKSISSGQYYTTSLPQILCSPKFLITFEDYVDRFFGY